MKVRDRIRELRRVRAADLDGAPWNWRTHPDAQRHGRDPRAPLRQVEQGSLWPEAATS